MSKLGLIDSSWRQYRETPTSRCAGRADEIFYNTYWDSETFYDDEDYSHARPIYHNKIQGYIDGRLDPYNPERGCNFTYFGAKIRRLQPDEEIEKALLAEIDETLEYMLDPISGSAARNKEVIGIVCIHVDDILFCGTKAFSDYLVNCLKTDFQIGSMDTNDLMFCGRRKVTMD